MSAYDPDRRAADELVDDAANVPAPASDTGERAVPYIAQVRPVVSPTAPGGPERADGSIDHLTTPLGSQHVDPARWRSVAALPVPVDLPAVGPTGRPSGYPQTARRGAGRSTNAPWIAAALLLAAAAAVAGALLVAPDVHTTDGATASPHAPR